jgi:hypothetical protein
VETHAITTKRIEHILERLVSYRECRLRHGKRNRTKRQRCNPLATSDIRIHANCLHDSES